MIVKEISYGFYCQGEECDDSESFFLGSGGSRKEAIQMARRNGWKISHQTGFKSGIPIPRNVLCPECK